MISLPASCTVVLDASINTYIHTSHDHALMHSQSQLQYTHLRHWRVVRARSRAIGAAETLPPPDGLEYTSTCARCVMAIPGVCYMYPSVRAHAFVTTYLYA